MSTDLVQAGHANTDVVPADTHASTPTWPRVHPALIVAACVNILAMLVAFAYALLNGHG